MARNRSKEAAAKFREMQQAVKDLTESLNKMMETQNEMAEKAAKRVEAAEEKDKKGLARIAERLKKEKEGAEERIETLKKEAALAKDLTEKADKVKELYDEQKKALEAEAKILRKKLDITDEEEARLREITEQLAKNAEENKKITKEIKEQEEGLQRIDKYYDSYFNTLKKIASGDFLGVLQDGVNSLTDGLTNLAKKGMIKATKGAINLSRRTGEIAKHYVGNNGLVSLLGQGAQGAMASASGFAASAASAAALGVALGAVIVALLAVAVAIGAAMILAKFTLELENSARELTKVTGLTKDFSHAMHENATELRAMGITAEDINNSVTALNSTFTDFSMLSTSTARNVAETTAVLGKLGMSADDTARGFQTLTKGLGQTPEMAANTMVAMDALARDLGVSTSKIGSDFAAAAGHLQKLSGPEALQSFKQLSVISKATGIEVSRLLAITEKFDTFEGAATQAGKLNAALGGNFVNSMELLTATNPAERFEMIRDAILDAGLSFDEMSYYQKKFYADSMGMADVGELALAMSGDFSAVNSELGKTQADYEAAAERAKSFQSVQEELKNSFYQLMPVIEPLLEKIGQFTEQFTKFVEENKNEVQDVFRDLGDIMITLVDTFIALTPVMSVILKLFSGLIRLTIFLSEKFGMLAILNYAFKDSMTVKKSPSLLDAVSMMGEGLSNIGKGVESIFSPISRVTGVMKKLKDALFDGDSGLTANVQMTAAGVAGIGDASAKTAATVRAAAPVIANNTAIRNASSNTNTTINNGGGSGETGINIRFDNKKFADLFDVQVEKSIGRAARKAVI